MLLSGECLIQTGNDIFDPCLNADPGMTARMEHDIFNPERIHTRHVLADHRVGKFIDFFFRTRQIHGIRRMRKNRFHAVFLTDLLKTQNLLFRIIFITRSPRIAAEYLHGIRSHSCRVFGCLIQPFRD